MKKFKAKKKRNIFKFVFLALFIYIVFQVTFNTLIDFKLEKNNKDFIVSLLNDSNHHLLYKERKNNVLDKFIKFFMDDPTTILANTFNYSNKTSSDSEEIGVLSEYVEDPNPVEIDNPRIYLYNTHQLEGYDASDYSDYNITPNVQMTSYLLKDKLNNMKIPTIVESGNITDFLNSNNWSYNYSYKASRYFIEETIKKHNNLDLIVDIHRDSISHDSSTINIDGKGFAKVMFVVGKDYDNYEKNLDLANKLNNILKEYNSGLSRGVIIKGGSSVNGIYNQDLSPKMVLIECGGMENSLDEVINTVDILSKVIDKYLGDSNGE